MKRLLFLLALLACTLEAYAEPLRVFIRAGDKNRGQEVHAHPRFLAEWKTLLTERGMQVDGGLDWPTAGQAAKADVIVAYAQDGGNATPEQEKVLEAFVKRGGGLVVIHTASVSFTNPGWYRDLIGGAWVPKETKFKEGPMDLYYTENQYIGGGHPITKGAANFHLDDEIYYDMDVKPEARILASAYTPKVKDGKKPAEGGKAHIYDIQPQMWAYERTFDGGSKPYRSFVSIPGHLFKSFGLPQYRAILIRGIAWAAQRANLDEYVKADELEALTYPEGGPQRPSETLAHLEVHPDFTMKLVAAEPLINKPMNFDWDPAGRLWVAETPEYPNGRRGMRPDYRGKEWKDHGGIDPEPGEQTRAAQDKISILTDTNGDGVMDKKEVFYEGLDLVTGLVFYKDGVIVTQAPDILWLRDTNADGKADKVEKLYSGLGTRDTHAVINNPRWGWDGWIYATHGYSGSQTVTNAKGETQGTIGSGVVRFKPDGSKIEQYTSKGGNTWGLTVTGDNRLLWTQPTSGTLLNHTVLPESNLALGKLGNTTSYKTVIGSQKSFSAIDYDRLAYVQIDRVGDFTAAAGTVIYDGGAWPAEYNGDYFTTEPTINIIAHQRLTPEASSYAAHKLPGREETEFIRSKDMWWRPIEVRVGPDGAMYVADFYNQAVIHNDTRGPDHNNVNAAVRPDRDHYFGRIWKIEHKQSQKLAAPDLSKADAAGLTQALEHPNRAVRMTAARLLNEKFAGKVLAGTGSDAVKAPPAKETIEPLSKLARSSSAETRIASLWTLAGLDGLPDAQLVKAFRDKNPAVRRNAALVLESLVSRHLGAGYSKLFMPPELINLLADPDAQVRVAALRALATPAFSERDAKILVASWMKFDDDYQRSAAIAAASQNPVAVITAAIAQGDASFGPLVAQLARQIGEKNDAATAAKLIVAVAEQPASADPLKAGILNALNDSLRQPGTLTPEVAAALGKLLDSGVSNAALPIVAQWDTKGDLKGRVQTLVSGLLAKLGDAATPDDARISAARSLLGLRGAMNREVIVAVAKQLSAVGSPGLKRALVLALGEQEDISAGREIVAAFAQLPAPAQAAAFDTVLKRADWTGLFLDAIQSKTVDLTVLGPANAFRLRSHPEKRVAVRAAKLLDELNPLAKAKKDAIAKLAPLVEQPGNAANGKTLFVTSCAICHQFGDTGAKIGPALTGMGTHGAGELLTAIVDPNAEVEPSFLAWNIETKDGQFFNGVIESENPTTITLKSLAGVQQVRVADIKARTNTGHSLMPEGFEGLGAEAIRDIIAYMQSVDGGKFRTVDLRDAFTATTGTGLYISQEQKNDTLHFVKTGTVTVEGIPFNIVSPDKAPLNVIVLKGGPEKSYAGSMPAKVEAKLGGFTANRLHFLSGIAGWGSKGNRTPADLVKLTVQYADGQKETLTFQDGIEFADYIGHFDVPGSKFAAGLVKDKQLRLFSKQLSRTAAIEKVTLESVDPRRAAATFVAITAEQADPNAAPLPVVPANWKPAAEANPDAGFVPQFNDPVPQPPAARPAKGPRVLLVGGGSSHDFVKFFGATDKATLAPQAGWTEFTQNANGVAPILKDIDVLIWSANQPVSAATREALINYVRSGKGLIAYHPGTWYAWNNFPQWNKEVVGGGTRKHDKLGPFTVKITNAQHPITAGVSASFEVTDELYHYAADPAATPIDVLAEATSPATGQTYPQVFIVKHPQSKIVGITLGHDARAHDLPDFQKLLKQAVQWVSGAATTAQK